MSIINNQQVEIEQLITPPVVNPLSSPTLTPVDGALSHDASGNLYYGNGSIWHIVNGTGVTGPTGPTGQGITAVTGAFDAYVLPISQFQAINYAMSGSIVTLTIPGCTGDQFPTGPIYISVTDTIGSPTWPSMLTPITSNQAGFIPVIKNNSIQTTPGYITLSTGGVCAIYADATGTTFTQLQINGLVQSNFTYSIQ